VDDLEESTIFVGGVYITIPSPPPSPLPTPSVEEDTDNPKPWWTLKRSTSSYKPKKTLSAKTVRKRRQRKRLELTPEQLEKQRREEEEVARSKRTFDRFMLITSEAHFVALDMAEAERREQIESGTAIEPGL